MGLALKNGIATFGLLLLLGVVTLVGAQDLHALKRYYKDCNEDQCLKLWIDSTRSCSQVVLIRHGEPALNKKGWRNRDGAIQYMHDYDSVGVYPFDPLPLCHAGLPRDTIYHSPVPRAAHTATLAFEGFPAEADSGFREFERKAMKFCNIRMPLKFWTGGSRVLWLLGMNKKGIESFREAKSRAGENAARLAKKAQAQGIVVVVAHGLHNNYVKKNLRKLGWKKVHDEGNGYLSVKVMALQNKE